MLRYGNNDIRLFYENDARFLKQFKESNHALTGIHQVICCKHENNN